MKEETLKKSVGFSAIGSIGTQVVTLLGFIILARILSPYEFGIMVMVTIFTAFAAIFVEMGMGDALVQNLQATEKHYSTVFWFVVLMGVILFGLFIACADLIAIFFGVTELTDIYQVCALLLPLNALAIVPMALLKKRQKFKQIAIIELLSVSLGFVVAVFLALQEYGVWALVANLFCISIVRWIVASIMSHWVPKNLFSKREFLQLWDFSGYLFLATLFSYIADNADRLLVGKYFNSSILGVYEASSRVANTPSNFLIGTLCRVFFPVYVRLNTDVHKIKRLHLKLVQIVFFFSAPVMMGMSALSDHLVPTLFGEQWNGMIEILIIFGFVYLFRTVVSLGAPVYLSQGATKLQFYVTFCMRVNVLAAMIIGLQFGLEGLLLGLLISRTINFFPSLYFSGRLIGISMSEYSSRLFPTFVSGMGMFSGVLIAKHFIDSQVDSLLNLILFIVFGGSIYVVISLIINRSIYNEVYTYLKNIRSFGEGR